MGEYAKVVNDSKELRVVLPLTQPTGKVRIKQRSFFADYGIPVAARQNPINMNHYIEWQIGYDLEKDNTNVQLTTLNNKTFLNYKNKVKYSYELGEIVYYSYKQGLIDLQEIKNVYSRITDTQDEQTFEQMQEMNICRTNPTEVKVNNMDFYRMTLMYPMLVNKFGKYDIYAEITIKEKQRAVGTQAMLYVCLPITELRFADGKSAVGRVLNAKETAEWVIERNEALLALEIFRIFGMLSPKHRFDVLAILKMLFDL